MSKRELFARLMLAMALVMLATGQSTAQTEPVEQTAQQQMQKSTLERRREAQERLRIMLEQRDPQQAEQLAPLATPPSLANVQPPIGINPAVDVNLPNFAYSPNLRKFVDSLPGLAINPAPGDPAVNQLGQYIPVAVPDQTTYPGSDYYEIGLVEYRERMHSDLPAPGTLLRGYRQLNGGDPNPHYLGPVILAQKGRPVRVKFTNFLPTGAGGNLFLPVDTTVMGAGMFHTDGPNGTMIMGDFTQNRATLHLHGGLSPWISDGTPHQWITPAGENTMYPKGASVFNVPDMPDPGPGSQTFYWTNEQSARLMFYHDHAWGITRLNVYAGEAAGYLVTDAVEDDLIDGTNTTGGNIAAPAPVIPNLGGLYRYGIPLVVQDKTFVNDASTPPDPSFPIATHSPTAETLAVDPLWDDHVPSTTGGDLWFPHEYLPNENLYDPSGFWYMGRWDYGPWILPPMFPMHDVLPSPSHVPEAFMDTMVVNGTAYPYLELPATVVRFRILNACNDRMLNLSLFEADPANPTEVKMVPAAPGPNMPQTWPIDGRDGGVPDPATAGPDWLQIGNESGFLAKLAVIPAQPVNYDYDRTSATFGNVSDVGLFLPPAVRADAVVDFTGQEGKTFIVYNDAPAPMSLFDARYDIFTDSADWREKGGAPPSAPGFGPNTRTIMQIRIAGTGPAFDLTPLTQTTALAKAFAVAQDQIIVPEEVYNDAYGTAAPNVFANIMDESLNVTGTTQPVERVMLELPGLGYTTPPTVAFFGGGGSGAVAQASLNGVTGITLLSEGSGYISTPVVSITAAAGDTGTGATAEAIVSGGVVTSVVITNQGSNYLLPPTVTISGGGAVTQATAQAVITLGSVGAITLINGGSGYTKAPFVYLQGGGGTGAVAVAMLAGSKVLDGKNLVEGMDMEYGRMNAVLGSTPNPLTPTVGAGPVIGAAFYIDPPTEVLKPDDERLWRLMHLGVDSHAMHFHLFEVQVVNRVDWTNTILPPYEGEIGWKETIRTNPFEDIIVALRPKASAMKLPFGLPNSRRLLDPSMPEGSFGHFQPVLPPPGIPAVAQIKNVMTDFGWEYVWHCHLLGHEENDMMRPIVFDVPRVLPGAPVLTTNIGVTDVTFNWTDSTPFDYVTQTPVSTLGNPANEIGFRIEAAPITNGVTGAYAQIGSALANRTSATLPLPGPGNYSYRVVAYNAAGDSPSNVSTTQQPPAAPTNVSVNKVGNNSITVGWTDNSADETGFEIQRAASAAGPWTTFSVGANKTSYTSNKLARKTTYYFQVRSVNNAGASAWTPATPVAGTTK